jgi:hypothetical protein
MKQMIEKTIREDIASEMATLRDAEVAALTLWLKTQESIAASIAADPTAVRLAQRIIDIAADPSTTQATILSAQELADLRAEVEPLLQQHGYMDMLVVDRNLRFVAGMKNELILQSVPEVDQITLRDRVFEGKTSVSVPRPSVVLLPDRSGQLRAGVPTMFAWAPLAGSDKKIIGAIGIRLRPQDDFSHILSIGRTGKSGETYAFSRDGKMLSVSRFEEDLRRVGLLRPEEESTLTISLYDPGVDLTRGERPSTLPGDRPLTAMAASAVKGETGIDPTGYRDYRGVPVVGAWTWLSEYDMGIATEQDLQEALAPVRFLQWFFWGLMGLLGLAAVGIFGVTLLAARLDRKARQASLEVKRLGQYALDEKIGEGAMGVVYRAHHAMLHRPTAVKFLDPQKTNDQSIARFEREVRLTSQLSHPNTITIFDYGRTPEGVFYYAMELVNGTTLEALVVREGAIPVGRTIWFLRQICGSLAEAHEAGLVHRDIKPANIMVCTCGGVRDFVKVLDFGLAKAVDAEKQARLTAAGAIAGTPLYLAPEAIQDPDHVDARADLYAVGAVAYFLLTGRPLFEGRSVMDILQMHLKTEPTLPSSVAPRPVPAELDRWVLAALAKDPAQRPPSARVMLDQLDEWSQRFPWSQADARGTAPTAQTMMSPTPRPSAEPAADETTFLQNTEFH